MPLRFAIIMLLGSFACAGSANPPAAIRCLNGLKAALLAGGFSGSTDCQHDRLAMKYVGKVQKARRIFQVYAYRYALSPPCAECAIHGGQRIIFMEQGRYVGQYEADFVQAVMRHDKLVFQSTDPAWREPVTVRFTTEGPPQRFWVGGEVISLFQ